jgi:hypothetical protein
LSHIHHFPHLQRGGLRPKNKKHKRKGEGKCGPNIMGLHVGIQKKKKILLDNLLMPRNSLEWRRTSKPSGHVSSLSLKGFSLLLR